MSRDPMDEWIDQACEADAQDIDIDEFDDLIAGPPLSIEEIGQAHADLARWQTPEAFKALVDALCARCTSKDWFNSPRLKFLHDAFVLARFARAKAAQSVRLAGAAEPWRDGFVRLNGTVHNIEATSTHGGRRLGDEYREVKGPTMDPVENWGAGKLHPEASRRGRGREKPQALWQPLLARRLPQHQRIRHPAKGDGSRHRRGQGTLWAGLRSHRGPLERAALLNIES